VVKKATPHLDKLLARVLRATSHYGEKSNLARFIGVPPQRVNDWLNGGFEPSGETTLLLLEWVSAAEAKQQKKRAGSASTQPALEARNQKSRLNEKPKTSPEKG